MLRRGRTQNLSSQSARSGAGIRGGKGGPEPAPIAVRTSSMAMTARGHDHPLMIAVDPSALMAKGAHLAALNFGDCLAYEEDYR